MPATVRSLAASAVASFLPSSMPRMSRQGYRWELTSACMFSFVLACAEAGVVGVIAAKAFNAGPLTVATVAAAPSLAYITSLLWTRFLRGRDRVDAVNLLQGAAVACVFAIALAPLSAAGTAILVVSMLLLRSLLAGVITGRADIWRTNYPRSARARATGKLTVVNSVVVSAYAMLIALAMDAMAGEGGAWIFRVFFALAAALGVGGLLAFRQIRWRGRREFLAEERRRTRGENGAKPPRFAMLDVLKKDPAYRSFMLAQMTLGLGAMAGEAPFILALDDLGLGYTESIALAQAIPFIVPVAAVPLWARLLDRVHIVHFRVYHSWAFVAALALMGAGVLAESLPLLFVARIVMGVANAGGMLAWNIGHHDFAPPSLATLYMGIHVTLTGVRGAVAPFVGAAAYTGGAISLGDAAIAWPALGGWIFFPLAALAALGALQFLALHRRIRRAATATPLMRR